MQAQFRLLDTDKGRLFRVTKDNQKAEKTKSSIGKAGGRNRFMQFFFVKIDLDGAAMNFRGDIIEFIIKEIQLFNNGFFNFRAMLQIVQHQPEVAHVF